MGVAKVQQRGPFLSIKSPSNEINWTLGKARKMDPLVRWAGTLPAGHSAREALRWAETLHSRGREGAVAPAREGWSSSYPLQKNHWMHPISSSQRPKKKTLPITGGLAIGLLKFSCVRRENKDCLWQGVLKPDFQLVRTTVHTGSHNFLRRFTLVHIIFSVGSRRFTYFLRRRSQCFRFTPVRIHFHAGSHRFTYFLCRFPQFA